MTPISRTSKLAGQIIKAIGAYERAGGNRHRLALKSGVNDTQIFHLMTGARKSLRLETAEMLAGALGFEIVMRRKGAPRRRK